MSNYEKDFIAEIKRNHGEDSIQYVWACATVREAMYKRAKGEHK